MSQDGKGDTSTLSILFLTGAIGIGIWFLAVVSDFIEGVSDFIDSGVSPVYAVFFFVPIFGVFLVVVVLASVVKAFTGPSKDRPVQLTEAKTCQKCGVANHPVRKNCGSCKNKLS